MGWKYSSKKADVSSINGNNQWAVDLEADRIYVRTYNGLNPNAEGDIRIEKFMRRQIFGCLKASCITETAGTPKANRITGILQSFNFDNLSGIDAGLTDWDNNTVDIVDDNIRDDYHYEMFWSPYADEKNIVYALRRSSVSNPNKLVRLNVDTGTENVLLSFDPANYGDTITPGDTIAKAEIIGFTKDAANPNGEHPDQIIIELDSYTSEEGRGQAYRFDIDKRNNFANPHKVALDNLYHSCDKITTVGDLWWYPQPWSIHGCVSPDWKYMFSDGGGGEPEVAKNNGAGGACSWYGSNGHEVTIADETWYPPDAFIPNNRYFGVHPSWNTSDDWFLTTKMEIIGSDSRPTLRYNEINQVLFDRNVPYDHTHITDDSAFTVNPLYVCCGQTHKNAGRWDWIDTSNNNKKYIMNYAAHTTTFSNSDGTMLRFNGTNGKYSMDDKVMSDYSGIGASTIGNNWEGIGTWIAELVQENQPEDINNDFKVNIKDIQLCIKAITSPSSITLEQLAKCKAVALPTDVANIKDIQDVIRKIIGE